MSRISFESSFREYLAAQTSYIGYRDYSASYNDLDFYLKINDVSFALELKEKKQKYTLLDWDGIHIPEEHFMLIDELSVRNLRRELSDIRRLQKDADRRVEMLTFQAEEIEAARLKPGEDLDLKQERDRLANAESLATLAQAALAALDEGTPEAPSAFDLLGQAAHAVASLARIDAAQNELSVRAEELFENLTDLAQELRHYLDRIEYNPKRLEQVEERLDLIHRLANTVVRSRPRT